MPTAGERRLRVAFPSGVWAADVEQRYGASSRARRVADESRRRFEAEGVPEAELQACEADGPRGTQLGGCLKVYLPLGPRDPRERPFGMVFIDVGDTEPAPVLLAYGVRHQPDGSHAEEVYDRAHRRLHPGR